MRIGMRLFAPNYDRWTQTAAESLVGQAAPIRVGDLEQTVGEIVSAQAVDNGRAVEVEIEINDEALDVL
jgi:hypothetical protein